MVSHNPGVTEWVLLVVIGGLAGAVNALRKFRQQGKTERAIVGATEWATGMFVTITSFMVLQVAWPLLIILGGLYLPDTVVAEVRAIDPTLAMIGFSGVIAHFGLRQSIRLALKIVDRKSTPPSSGA